MAFGAKGASRSLITPESTRSDISRETAGAVQREMWLQWGQAQGLDTEARLARLAAWIVAADAAGHNWGLMLPGTELAPSNGAPHRHAALQALARW